MFHVVLLCFVQVNLHEPAAGQLRADPLAHDFTQENRVLQDRIVRGCESVVPVTLLLTFCKAFSDWLRQNSPLCNKDNVLPTELFLQLAHEADLDFLERNSFPTSTNFNFLGCCYIQLPELGLEV